MKANPYINPVPTKDGQVLGYVHSLETFGAVDGPGIRFVAFMQGCNMRCKFCHNPDTWKKNVGTQMTASELLEKALPYRAFWGEDGGITLSGARSYCNQNLLWKCSSSVKNMVSAPVWTHVGHHLRAVNHGLAYSMSYWNIPTFY